MKSINKQSRYIFLLHQTHSHVIRFGQGSRQLKDILSVESLRRRIMLVATGMFWDKAPVYETATLPLKNNFIIK